MLLGFKGMSIYCIVVTTAYDSFFIFLFVFFFFIFILTPISGAVAPKAQHSLGTSALGRATVYVSKDLSVFCSDLTLIFVG